MGGGGKGGGGSSATQIPKWLQEPSVRNLARAEQVQQMEYQPYIGLDVAAQTPMQQLANQQAASAAQAFGMAPAGFNPNAGMPQAYTSGGVTGYTSYPMYEQAKQAAEALDPTSAQLRKTLYGVDTGYRPTGTPLYDRIDLEGNLLLPTISGS